MLFADAELLKPGSIPGTCAGHAFLPQIARVMNDLLFRALCLKVAERDPKKLKLLQERLRLLLLSEEAVIVPNVDQSNIRYIDEGPGKARFRPSEYNQRKT
jgi:hypothetical protein